jgi:hypothetical protein
MRLQARGEEALVRQLHLITHGAGIRDEPGQLHAPTRPPQARHLPRETLAQRIPQRSRGSVALGGRTRSAR